MELGMRDAAEQANPFLGVPDVQVVPRTIGRSDAVEISAYVAPADQLSPATAVLLNEQINGTLVRRGGEYHLRLLLPQHAAAGPLELLAREVRIVQRLLASEGGR
jgi:hypothetical protein